ncbi:hypothetical protein JXA02_14400 [candidate division KSB1 bacterium]|nr:hypothetical protein [candidate division KSB1 bacterium]
MKKTLRFFFYFFCVFILKDPAFSQFVYVDPASTVLTLREPQIYENLEPVLLGVSTDSWAVSCTAEPLVHESGVGEIPISQMYLKQDLSEEYQTLTGSIDLGSGAAPAMPYEAIINSLFFQVRTSGTELAGLYTSQVHFYNMGEEAALLTISLTIDKKFNFSLQPLNVSFLCSDPSLYNGDDGVDLAVIESNTDEWHIEAELAHTSAPNFINGSNIFIKSPLSDFQDDAGAGPGYQPLQENPILMSGEQVGLTGSTQLLFRLLTDWTIPPGGYDVTIYFYVPELGSKHQLSLSIEVAEYSTFSLSESAIFFHADGPPAVWDADTSVKLHVGSNTSNWAATCEATSLKSAEDEIPNERLFLRDVPFTYTGDDGAGLGFKKMNEILQVADGGSTPPQDVCEMWFRLQTMDVDLPGHYEGTITFTLFVNP